MGSSASRKIRVNGSCVSDATCSYTSRIEDMYMFSTIHVALLARYMRQAELVHRAKVPRGEPVRVLDVGCNNGAALHLYSSQSFQTQNRRPVDYVGVDLDEGALKEAARRVSTKPSCVAASRFVYADITRPWGGWCEPESFDVIWFTECVEHVPEDLAEFTLQQAYQAARPGATMLLSTPAPFDPAVLVWPESHDHEFTREEMRTMLDAAGWTRVDEYGLNTNWTRGRRRLRLEHPEIFKTYEQLRHRLGGTMARVFASTLAPDVCDDLVHICVKA